ncbi:hypothetical protein GRI89_11220 [Altererythrobacter salegens]|uniref:Uncharacterized protein n=1 Tax=Croceibacterium salegens TaxID=1737568 RepID=A0A6I4SXE0_9SPHN|nr:hypothetical protein [Croceibacterium salegens]MXO60108.1 hypothetical protein [Croceibacterium salegens]
MRNQNRTPFSATTAIAAALALTVAPALAQDASTPTLDGPIVNSAPVAAPSPAAPDPAAPAYTAPVTTVSPSQPAPTTTSVPVVQDVPAAPEPTVEEAAPAPQAATPAPKKAAPAPRPSPSASLAAPVAPESKPVDLAEPVAVAPLAQDAFAQPEPAAPPAQMAPTPEQARDVTAILAMALAGLIAIAVAVLLAMAFRRRKRTAQDRRAVIVPNKPVPYREVSPPSVATPMSRAAAAPVIVERPAPVYHPESESTGAAVALPREVPATFEERDALIRRMVDARPDKANPFTNRRARRRRARLILQSIGRKFENARPWIDFSQYPQIWPSQAPTARSARPSPATNVDTRILEPA